MDTFDCIIKRKTIRSFIDKPVEMEQVNMLLQAGANAPSAGNQQSWQFVLVDDKQLLSSLGNSLIHGKFISKADGCILVIMNKAGRYPEFAPQDCSAAMQNMLLAAYNMELGAVWVGIYPDDGRMELIRELLNIPSELFPFAAMPFGHVDKLSENSVRLTAERVHYNGW